MSINLSKTSFRLSLLHFIPIISLTLLLLLPVICTVSSSLVSSTSATNDQTLNVTIPAKISLSTSDSEVEIEGSAQSDFVTGSLSVDVGTNNTTGYELSLASADDGTTYTSDPLGTALINEDDEDITIPSITTASTPSQMTTTSWSFTYDLTLTSGVASADDVLAATFYPIPAYDSARSIKTTLGTRKCSLVLRSYSCICFAVTKYSIESPF